MIGATSTQSSPIASHPIVPGAGALSWAGGSVSGCWRPMRPASSEQTVPPRETVRAAFGVSARSVSE
jgi:hypothetical protein